MLILITKSFISEIWHGSEYASAKQFSIRWKYALCNTGIWDININQHVSIPKTPVKSNYVELDESKQFKEIYKNIWCSGQN